MFVGVCSRRAPTAPKPNSSRAAGAGGSSNTMLKLYTDSGENGLQVYVDAASLTYQIHLQFSVGVLCGLGMLLGLGLGGL